MKRFVTLLTFCLVFVALGQSLQAAELWLTGQLGTGPGEVILAAKQPRGPGDADRQGRGEPEHRRAPEWRWPPHHRPWPHPYPGYIYRPVHPPVVIVPYPGHPPVIIYPGHGCIHPYPRSYIYYQGNRFGIGINF
jgi:hypothetical protein